MDIDFKDPKIRKLFTNPTKWCHAFLRNPMDSDQPLVLKSYQQEVMENTRKFRRMVLRYGRRMGKCSYINDLCTLSDGTRLTFGELLERYNNGEQLSVLTMDDDLKIISSLPVIVSDNGIKPVYTLETKSGKKVTATGNHPFLTVGGWKKLDELTVSDTILVPSELKVESKYKIDNYKVKFLAYTLSDGSIIRNVSFTNSNERLLNDFKNNLFGHSLTREELGSGCKTIYVSSNMKNNEAIDYLRQLDLYGKNSHTKFIPNEIIKLSKPQQALFLSRLFACDGWASVSKSNRKSSNCEIGYCSVSEELIYGVGHLLTRFGIRYFINKKNVKYKNTIKIAFQLCIRTKTDILNFIDKIGIFSKEDACANVKKHVLMRNDKDTYFDSFPTKELIENYNINHPRKNNIRKQYKRTSKSKFIDYSLKYKNQEIVDLANASLFADEIKCISYQENKRTVAVEVPKTHNYIQNDVITHNTVVLCADTLWWVAAYPFVKMIEDGAKKQQKIKILIATPYETQIKMIWNTYLALIGDSPLLQDQLTKVRTSDVHVLEFSNGSVIEGYTIGISSSNKGTSLRGLDANILFIDEMDAIPREIIDEVLMPIWTGHPDCRLRASSTPTGKRDLFYDWCWPQTVDITTDSGIKKISDVEIGDYVFGEDCYFEKVITTYKQPFKGKLVEFSTGVSEKLSCTPNHEIFIYGNGFTKAEKLVVGDYILVPKEKYSFQEMKIKSQQYYFEKELDRLSKFEKASFYKNYADAAEDIFGSRQMRRQLFKYRNDKKKYNDLWPFDNRKRQHLLKAQEFLNTIHLRDQRKFYKFLGYYLAEGNILKDFSLDNHYYAGIQLTFNSKERQYIDECVSIASDIFPNATIKTTYGRKDNSTSILIYSSWISYVLIELCGEYSHKKKLHPYIMATCDKAWCDIQDLGQLLLDGYINGDGFKLQSGKYSFVSTSKELAKQLLSISINIGIPSTFHTSVKTDKHNVYTIYQLSDNSYKIKYDKEGRLYIRVDKIYRKSYDDYVYNLETERTHTYNVQNLCTHNCTRSEELGWWHKHYPSWHADNDRWISIAKAKEMGLPLTESTEFQVKSTTPSDAYAREYGAEFGEEYGGVYKHHLINSSIIKYCRNVNIDDPDIWAPGFKQNPAHKYIIGVDWNSYVNGGQVVLLEYCTTPTIVSYYDDNTQRDVTIDFTGKYRLFYRRGIKSKDATQRMTREEIIKLLRQYKIDYVYVDYGAGDTNIEELSIFGRQHPELELHKKLRVIDSGATTEHWDHVAKQKVKKRNKSLMINFSVLSLEEHMFILPKEEDQPTRLVGQMRGYRVKNITARGEFSYEGDDHILDAFNLAIYGFQQNFGSILTQTFIHNLIPMPDPRGAYYPRREMETQNSPIKNSRFQGHIDPEKEDYYMNKHKPRRGQMPIFGQRSINFSQGPFGRRSF